MCDMYQIFDAGGASLDLNSVPHKPYKWLTDIIWLNIIQVSKLHGFSEVPNQVYLPWHSFFFAIDMTTFNVINI